MALVQTGQQSPSFFQRVAHYARLFTPSRKRPRIDSASSSLRGASPSARILASDDTPEAPASGFVELTPSRSSQSSALASASPADKLAAHLIFPQEGAIRDPLGRTSVGSPLGARSVSITDTRSSSEEAAEMQIEAPSSPSSSSPPTNAELPPLLIESRNTDEKQPADDQDAAQPSSAALPSSPLGPLPPTPSTEASSQLALQPVDHKDAPQQPALQSDTPKPSAEADLIPSATAETDDMAASDAHSHSSSSVHDDSKSSNADAALPTDADVDHIQAISTAKVGDNIEGLLTWSAPLTTQDVEPPSASPSEAADSASSTAESGTRPDPPPVAANNVVDMTGLSDDSSSSDDDDPDKENDISLVQPSPLLTSDATLTSFDNFTPSQPDFRAPQSRHSFGGPMTQAALREQRSAAHHSSRFATTFGAAQDGSADGSATEQIRSIGLQSIGLQTSFVQPARHRLPQASTPRQSLPSPGLHRSMSIDSTASSLASDATAHRKRRSSGIGFTKRTHIFQKQHAQVVSAYNLDAIKASLKKINFMRTSQRKTLLTQEQFVGLALKRRQVQRFIDGENKHPASRDDSIEILMRKFMRQKQIDAQSAVLPVSGPKLVQMERLARERRAQAKKLRGVLGRQALPAELTEEQDKMASATLSKRGQIAAIPGAQVEDHDVQKLRPRQWLNDEVINFYGNLILQRANDADKRRTEAMKTATSDASAAPEKPLVGKSARAGGKPQPKRPYDAALDAFWRVHFFSSFFWENLKNRGFDGVKRWTRRIDIFTKDLVLFPINLGNSHWVCGAINLRRRRFEYYDSLGARNPRAFELMRTYIAEEAKDKKKKHIDLRGWRDVFSDESPQQENGYDCGVFAAQTLEQISRRDPHTPITMDPPTISWSSDDIEADAGRMKITGADAEEDDDDVDEYEWNFGQENMPYLRRRMVYEIASQRLLD